MGKAGGADRQKVRDALKCKHTYSAGIFGAMDGEGPMKCHKNAVWNELCEFHGGIHPTTPELMTLLGQLTGWGDQSLTVDIGYKRRRDYNDQDDSYLNDRVWGFTASVKIIGEDSTVGAQGATLETALWSLCEAVVAKVSDLGQRRAETAAKAQDSLARFIAQRIETVDRGPTGPYR